MSGRTGGDTAGVRKRALFRTLVTISVVATLPACGLVVEYDYLGTPPPITSTTYTFGSGETRSIEGIYEAAGFDDVLVLVPDEPVPSDLPHYGSCVTDAFLDANFAAIEDHRPTPFKNRWRWYAHGLLVDKPCGELEGVPGGVGYQGAIWFPPPTCNSSGCEPRTRTREKFIVIRDSVQQSANMHVRVAVHELAHVLNLHHCDIGADDVDTYPTGFDKDGTDRRCLRHLIQHKESHESFVKPGANQEPFCGTMLEMPPDHVDVHVMEDKAGTAECAKTACSTLSALLEAASPAAIRLDLEPEKQSFEPGEPVTLRVVLDHQDDSGARGAYYGERSLDPQLRPLRIWVGTNENDLQPVDPLLLFDADLQLSPLTHRVEASGLDAWFLLPFDVKTTQQTLFAQATYTIANQVVRSEVVEVAINRPLPTEPPDPGVLELFRHPESRRFLYFLGGDHLDTGRANLEQVASDAPGTIYGTYANLALGVSLGLPFQLFDKKANRLQTRPADPVAARTHLDAAYPLIDRLPPTRQRSLVQVRGLVYEVLGDQAAQTDPRTAFELYGQSMAMFRTLPDLPRPLMMTRAEYDAKIDEQVRRVQAKLAQLPPPPPV